MNPGITEGQISEAQISEAQISALVDDFYTKVQHDPQIGFVFDAVVQDWSRHLAVMKNFWSSVLLGTGRYKGNPMMRHLPLELEPKHFERWLALFAETAHEIFAPESAELIIDKSHRIGQNLQYVSALVKQEAAARS